MAVLEAVDVTVRFGGLTALDRVSLHADAGRVTGLIGPNGAGKTTMFDVFTGLRPIVTGRVLMDGHDLHRVPTHRRSRLGMARTFQRLELFGALTVRENIACAASMAGRLRRGLEPPERTAGVLIDRVGLTAVADAPAATLPTGLGRLVELARALATRPRVLLLDEPASGLSEAETEGLAALLRDLAGEGIAILLVEHDMDLVMSVSDELYVLDFGRVLASGPPEQVRRDPAVLAAYLGSGDR